MNVLHLQPELNKTCGVTRSIYYLAKVKKYDSIVATFGGDNIQYFIKEGIEVVKLPSLFNNKFTFPFLIFELLKIVRKNKIEIIHSHHRLFDLAAWLISLIVPVKTVVSVQSIVYEKKLLSYKSKMIIAVSIAVKNHLINYFKINENKITIIHNFVDTSIIHFKKGKEQLKKELSIKDKFVFGFVGRIDIEEKGIDILLEAFERVFQKNSNVFLLMVGNGKNKDFVINFINSKNLPARVFEATDNIWDYYNIFDIFILPSRVEPFGIVLLESASLKIPVIASNVDGITELIIDGKNGLLFEHENIEDLVRKIKFCIENHEKTREFSQNLYYKVVQNYTTEKIIPKYEKLYGELITYKQIK